MHARLASLLDRGLRVIRLQPPAKEQEEPGTPGPGLWSALLVGVAVGLANVAKPVHIDDTLYLTIARWIVGASARPLRRHAQLAADPRADLRGLDQPAAAELRLRPGDGHRGREHALVTHRDDPLGRAPGLGTVPPGGAD